VQDTLLKGLIASVLPKGRRNAAFGLYYMGYGGGWLVGSITTALLYNRSRLALTTFAVLVQLASVPLFVRRAQPANRREVEVVTPGQSRLLADPKRVDGFRVGRAAMFARTDTKLAADTEMADDALHAVRFARHCDRAVSLPIGRCGAVQRDNAVLRVDVDLQT
jgi:hypothetical protein